MTAVEAKLHDLLELAQTVLDDLPIGLLVVSSRGTPLWFNREAEIVCAVWNRSVLRRDALPLKRAEFVLPPVLWEECQALLQADTASVRAEPRIVSEPDRGLHAVIRLLHRPARTGPPACYLQLDYRRPRGDRERPLSPGAVALLARLTEREREVAMRVREGLRTTEIAAELRRSPLTIKTQLAAVFGKLGVRGRTRVAALLNR
jgi:DNA-binding CsgD family transcriptional regulator